MVYYTFLFFIRTPKLNEAFGMFLAFRFEGLQCS